ncbi:MULTISPECIES: hypothetical protein [unclassified Ruegeria]|uniref:hypothetical protein n=1 Tax=unclassified Ruegeria TaxID=2625375 RepID=UPI001488AA12|nr:MULTISPECIES: hypothetical protein [unclassified Ruegeria]
MIIKLANFSTIFAARVLNQPHHRAKVKPLKYVFFAAWARRYTAEIQSRLSGHRRFVHVLEKTSSRVEPNAAMIKPECV